MTKIRSVTHNNRRRVFEVETAGGRYPMPYSKVHPRPGPSNPIARVFVDKELAREGFTYLLDSGEQGAFTSSRFWITTRTQDSSGMPCSTG